jgi:hypothetical protein
MQRFALTFELSSCFSSSMILTDETRSERSQANAGKYKETRPMDALVQWLFNTCKGAHEKAQSWADSSDSKGKISLTFIVSDDSGHSVPFMSSGVASAFRIERLKQAHMGAAAAAATSAAATAAAASATTTNSNVPLTKEEKDRALPKKWNKRDRETLIAFFRRKDDMKDFFAKVRFCDSGRALFASILIETFYATRRSFPKPLILFFIINRRPYLM